MVPLWKSRKFLLVLLDTAIALVGFVVGRFFPDYAKDILYILGLLQPVFVSIIVAISIEDAALKRAGLFPTKR